MRVLKNLTKNLNFSSQCIAFKNPKIFVQYEPEFLKKFFFFVYPTTDAWVLSQSQILVNLNMSQHYEAIILKVNSIRLAYVWLGLSAVNGNIYSRTRFYFIL